MNEIQIVFFPFLVLVVVVSGYAIHLLPDWREANCASEQGYEDPRKIIKIKGAFLSTDSNYVSSNTVASSN